MDFYHDNTTRVLAEQVVDPFGGGSWPLDVNCWRVPMADGSIGWINTLAGGVMRVWIGNWIVRDPRYSIARNVCTDFEFQSRHPRSEKQTPETLCPST